MARLATLLAPLRSRAVGSRRCWLSSSNVVRCHHPIKLRLLLDLFQQAITDAEPLGDDPLLHDLFNSCKASSLRDRDAHTLADPFRVMDAFAITHLIQLILAEMHPRFQREFHPAQPAGNRQQPVADALSQMRRSFLKAMLKAGR